jgi:hypothetical protein
MIENKRNILFLGLFVLSLSGCVKKKNYSQNPEIEFKSFTPLFGDTVAVLVIGFKDGDGDIGKEKEDKTNNLFITYNYFDTDSNKFVPFWDNLNNAYFKIPYTVRKPNDDYSNKSIDGEVAVKINQYRPSKKHKKIKYVIYLLDNSNNRSNILTTPEFIVP